jgi:hypothetical protein
MGTSASDKELTNQDIVVLAAYAVGGDAHYVDTEDVAIEASRLAPGRFSWRKYKDQVNIDTVRKRLWDAAKKDGLLIGSEKQGWLLTEAGISFAQAITDRAQNEDLSKVRQSQREQTWTRRERLRMRSETAFQKWEKGRVDDITAVEAERLFRIDDYVIGEARKARIKRAIETFRADTELGAAVKDISVLVRNR